MPITLGLPPDINEKRITGKAPEPKADIDLRVERSAPRAASTKESQHYIPTDDDRVPTELHETLKALPTRRNPRRRNGCRRCWKPIPVGDPVALVANQNGGGLTWVHQWCTTPADATAHGASTQVEPAELKAIQSRLEALEKSPPAQTIAFKVNDSPARRVTGAAHPQLEKVVRKLAIGQPVFCPGPTGSGKSFLAKQAAEALGLEFYTVGCSIGMTEGSLVGRSQPEGANGAFVYTVTPFMRAYEKGGLFLIDEIDAADSSVLLCINNAIANGLLDLAGRHHNPRAKMNADFRVIAAANTFGRGADRMYVGRNALDESTLDRFRAGVVAVEYSRELEASLWKST